MLKVKGRAQLSRLTLLKRFLQSVRDPWTSFVEHFQRRVLNEPTLFRAQCPSVAGLTHVCRDSHVAETFPPECAPRAASTFIAMHRFQVKAFDHRVEATHELKEPFDKYKTQTLDFEGLQLDM